MPTTPAFIVSLKPSQSAPRLSQMTDHSKAARTRMGETGVAASRRPLVFSRSTV